MQNQKNTLAFKGSLHRINIGPCNGQKTCTTIFHLELKFDQHLTLLWITSRNAKGFSQLHLIFYQKEQLNDSSHKKKNIGLRRPFYMCLGGKIWFPRWRIRLSHPNVQKTPLKGENTIPCIWYLIHPIGATAESQIAQISWNRRAPETTHKQMLDHSHPIHQISPLSTLELHKPWGKLLICPSSKMSLLFNL